MQEVYVVSDIHGQYRPFLRGLNELVKAGDKLFFLGDSIDRGKDSYQVLSLLLRNKTNNITMLCGNHELMFLEFCDAVKQYALLQQINLQSIDDFWDIADILKKEHYWTVVNGGDDTLADFKKHIKTIEELTSIVNKIKNLRYDASIIVNGMSYYMVHGSPQNAKCEKMLWEEAKITDNYEKYGDYILFGHRMTSHYQDISPMEVFFGPNNIIGIDTGAGAPYVGGRVCFFRLRDHKPFYYEII